MEKKRNCFWMVFSMLKGNSAIHGEDEHASVSIKGKLLIQLSSCDYDHQSND